MEYFFILGRNPVLSRAEIVSHLVGKAVEFKEIFFKRNFLVIDVFDEIKFDIQNFGGVVKLGEICFKGSKEEFERFLDKENLIDKNKFSYCVIGNIDEDLFKEKFKREKYKAVLKRGRKQMKMQGGGFILVPNAEFEFFAYDFNGIYFGVIEQDYSYSEIKERDMKKPVRREDLAISPRLAKILVNLSQVKEGELLLDGFCGVGGILQEALIRGVNVYGIDKDKKAIVQCKQNLKWLEGRYNLKSNYKLLNSDVRQAPNIKVDAIVSEPVLGKVLRKKPRDKEAENIVKSFEKMIVSVLHKLVTLKKENTKIVLTAPYIRNFSVDFERIGKQTGLKICNFNDVRFPIKESREGQFIGREIVVFC